MTVAALLFPGGLLDSVWRLNPEARAGFQKIGTLSAVLLMAMVGTACAGAAFGLTKRRPWGRSLAIGILAANLVGDSMNALVRHDLRTLIGLPIGGAMIAYLWKSRRWKAIFEMGMEAARNYGENRTTTTDHHHTTMTTIFPDSALAPQPSPVGFSELKAVLLEPLLVLGVSLFWIVALPFVAVSLMLVKIWDTVVALSTGTAAQANPLILRHGGAPKDIAALSDRKSARTAEI
jgi:hypothetical protein